MGMAATGELHGPPSFDPRFRSLFSNANGYWHFALDAARTRSAERARHEQAQVLCSCLTGQHCVDAFREGTLPWENLFWSLARLDSSACMSPADYWRMAMTSSE
jgi:hypothetical protein